MPCIRLFWSAWPRANGPRSTWLNAPSEGKSKREIMRCLKRYAAREIYRQITNPRPAPDNSDLRRRRDRPRHDHQRPSPANLANGFPSFRVWNADLIRNDDLAGDLPEMAHRPGRNATPHTSDDSCSKDKCVTGRR